MWIHGKALKGKKERVTVVVSLVITHHITIAHIHACLVHTFYFFESRFMILDSPPSFSTKR